MREVEATVRDAGAGLFLFRRFLLIRVLGRGGTGTVWLARDADLELEVALKLIGGASVRDEVAAEQLREETRLCLRLGHPHIVRIHSFHQEGARAAISMEHVKGQTLHHWRSSHPERRLSPAELESPLRQMIAAMHYAHERAGVFHLDLKPANLMIDEGGDLRVLDFGIGRARMAAQSGHFTGSGSVGYMSPQRRRSEPPAVSDDLYSTGALLRELLTGLPPLEDLEGTPRSVNESLRSLGVTKGQVPAAWDEAITACLEPDPRNRPASFAALGAALGFSDSAVEPLSASNRTEASVEAPSRQTNPAVSEWSYATIRRVPPTLERWGTRREGSPCWSNPLDYVDAVYRLLNAGEPLTAYEVVRDGLRWFPADEVLSMQLGLSLIRLGRPQEARRHLETCVPQRFRPEYAAALGKALLHESLRSGAAGPSDLAERALAELETAAADAPDFLVPMEAMVAAVLVGASAKSRTFAMALAMREVQEQSGWFEPTPGKFPAGWRPFASGLAALVSGDRTKAVARFSESAEGWGGALHDLAEARRLLEAVVLHCGLARESVDQFLPMPGVAVAVGHMFDRPERATPRFPRDREETVKSRLGEFIERETIGCGFASGACGTDILFHEELHRRGLPSTLVLPLPLSEPKQLGGMVHGEEDERRLLTAAESCAAVVATSRFDGGDDEVESAYCLACLLGLAGLYASSVGARLRPVAVWDGRAGDKRGGTADMVSYWRSLGLPVEVISMGDGEAGGSPEGLARLPEKIRSILVVRAEGHASWPDRILADFGEIVFPEILGCLEKWPGSEILADPAGGIVAAVFPDPRAAAAAASAVAASVTKLEMPPDPELRRLRYAMHAGPLDRTRSGGTRSGIIYGSHLNLVRSIRPPSGHLYGTETFAALLHITAPDEFALRYAGQSWLADGFGPTPLYEICPDRQTP